MKNQKIRTRISFPKDHIDLEGWFSGKHTYLWFGKNNHCMGIIHKRKLYRLAKAIVRRFEEE